MPIEHYARVLNDLDDVDTTGIANGDSLVYNSTTHKFEPGSGGGGGVAEIDDLSDVDINRSLIEADTLAFNATTFNFEPVARQSSCFYHDFDYTPVAAGDDLSIPVTEAPRNDADPSWVTALTGADVTVEAGIYVVTWITGFDYASAVSGTIRASLSVSGDSSSSNGFDQPDYLASSLPHQSALDVVLDQTTFIMSDTPMVIDFRAHASAAVAGVYGTARIAKIA